MTKNDPAPFKRWEIIYNRSESDDKWTVVAYLPLRGWLAVRAIIEMNCRSVKFWDCASVIPEKDLRESMEAIGLEYACITNPDLWIKLAS